MIKKFLAAGLIAAAALALPSCATRYIGPSGFVNYRDTDKIKTSRQSSSLGDGSGKLVSNYDEEYTYDDKGNLLKTKVTSYIDRAGRNKRFIVWETEYKVMGGKPVPYRVSANGVAFVEVEYELLTVSGNGAVVEDISERQFTSVMDLFMSGPDVTRWNVALSNYSVGFRQDDRFVKEIRRYTPWGASSLENVLTLGFDNIVLKKFKFSYEKMAEGIAKTYSGYHYSSQNLVWLTKGINVEYAYEWKAIADRACQTKMTYTSRNLILTAEEEYNPAGKRVKETWSVANPNNKNRPPEKIFEQTITY